MPEPATLLLLGSGLAGLAAPGWRKRNTIYSTRSFTRAERLGQAVQPVPEAGTLLPLGTGTLGEAGYGR